MLEQGFFDPSRGDVGELQEPKNGLFLKNVELNLGFQAKAVYRSTFWSLKSVDLMVWGFCHPSSAGVDGKKEM